MDCPCFRRDLTQGTMLTPVTRAMLFLKTHMDGMGRDLARQGNERHGVCQLAVSTMVP